MARALKYLRLTFGLAAGVIISLAAILYFIDFNEYRDVLAEQLSEALGRPLRIDGDLKLQLGLHTGFSAANITLSGDDGSQGGVQDGGRDIARIGRISFGLALWPLLDRRVEIDALRIEDADILIERQPDGRLNWAFGRGGDENGWALPRIDNISIAGARITYRNDGRDWLLAVEEFAIKGTAPAVITLKSHLEGRHLNFNGQVSSLDALLQNQEVRIEGKLAADGLAAAVTGRVFQPVSGAGVDLHITGRWDNLQDLLAVFGVESPQKNLLRGPGGVAFDLSDRAERLALHNITAKTALADGIKITATGRVGDALGLDDLALELYIVADRTGPLAALAGIKVPALGRVEATAVLAGSAGAPGLRMIDGWIRHDAGLAIDFQGAVGDLLGGRGVNLHVTGRTEQVEAVLGHLGMALGLRGRVEVAFDIKNREDGFALRNIKAELTPAAGVEITVEGHMDDAVALTGLELSVQLRADDAADLSPLAGLPVPPLSPFRVQGRIVGSAARPAIIDLDLAAGRPGGLSLTGTGMITEPLQAAGLDLKLRLQGPDSALLSRLAETALPALGRFDLAGRLRGLAARPRLSHIVGRFRHDNGTRLDVHGAFVNPVAGEGLDLGFELAIPDQAALSNLLAIELPIPAPLMAKGRLRGSGNVLQLDDLDLSMGNNDLTGQVGVDLAGERPRINVVLSSNNLDLSFLSPPAAEDDAAKAKAVAKVVAEGAVERMIPDLAVNLGGDFKFDGGIKYQVGQFRWQNLVLRRVHVTAALEAGVLTLRPSTAEVAAGQLVIEGRWDRGGLTTTFDLRRAEMKTLGPMIGVSALDGGLDLHGDLSSQGNDLRSLAAALDGTASLVISDGYVHNQYLDHLAKDLAVSLVKGKFANKTVRLNCFVNGYTIKGGVAVADVLLLDTENITLTGSGRIDLASEAIQFHLTPRPKNPSFVSLATPINVGGTLARPTFAPDSMAVAGSVATAVVGNLLLPGVGLLLPLLSAGTGEAHPCLNVIKDGKATVAGEQKATSTLGRIGGAVSEGVGNLLKLPGKLLGSE